MTDKVVVVKTWKEHQEEQSMRFLLKFIWYTFLALIPVIFIWAILCAFKINIGLSFYIALVIGGIVDILFFFRKKIKKEKKNSSNWEKIDSLPGWAFKRMNRKHKNKVKGDHYVYMRSKGKYYRKKYK